MSEQAEEQLITHLKDVHAMEEQALKQLERAVELAKDEELCNGYREHMEQSHEHEQAITDRIKDHDLEPSAVKDLTMRSGAVGLRQLAEIPPDTPIKLAIHMYAFEHLEIAAYEFLCRLAKEAGDDETAKTAEEILEQERAEAERVCGTFDRCAEQALEHAQDEGEQDDRDEDEDEREQDDSEAEEERDAEREPSKAS